MTANGTSSGLKGEGQKVPHNPLEDSALFEGGENSPCFQLPKQALLEYICKKIYIGRRENCRQGEGGGNKNSFHMYRSVNLF